MVAAKQVIRDVKWISARIPDSKFVDSAYGQARLTG